MLHHITHIHIKSVGQIHPQNVENLQIMNSLMIGLTRARQHTIQKEVKYTLKQQRLADCMLYIMIGLIPYILATFHLCYVGTLAGGHTHVLLSGRKGKEECYILPPPPCVMGPGYDREKRIEGQNTTRTGLRVIYTSFFTSRLDIRAGHR
jgi:hypothetical protein